MRISARCCSVYIGLLVAGCVLLTLSTSAMAAPQADPSKPAVPASTAKPTLSSHPLQRPPVIDGVLDDDAWNEAPVETGEWLSYNPLHGDTHPADRPRSGSPHDADYLYFAFQCDDPEPSGDQDLHHAPRQHLVRRLGRHQPRCARHRPAVLSPDGQPQRRAARHAQQRVGRRGPVAGLRVGQRRPAQRQGICRRDAPAAPVDPLPRRQRRADGHPVLAARQPHRRVGRVAAARTRQVGVREARLAACSTSCSRGCRARSFRRRRMRARSCATRRRAGRARTTRRTSALSAKYGLHVDHHARRDDQSGLQPGRERRVPGRGEPALSDVLLREASVLHGGSRASSRSPARGTTTACSARSTRAASSIRCSARRSRARSGAGRSAR